MLSASDHDPDHDEPLLHPDDLELDELNDSLPVSSFTSQQSQRAKPRVSALWIATVVTITVIGFTINTEATAYLEDRLNWKKPFAMFYITHSSLALPWVCHVCYLRLRAYRTPYMTWVRDYNNQLRGAIASNEAFASSGSRILWLKRKGNYGGPLDFIATTMAIITVVLAVSGLSWFTALSLTTPADLTAIYNCSTFFAAAFSVPILQERLGRVSMLAVAMSLIGTFTIAYGDTTADHENVKIGAYRFVGNCLAALGAVAFGLYEVLFKKWATPSRPESQESSLPLALAASALTGFYSFVALWPGFLALHLTGLEPFVLPSIYASMWVAISVLTGAASVTLLVVLVVWTDPVFGSMANVLSVFTVALADWLLWGSVPSWPTYIGGALILLAFVLLARDTLTR